MTVTFDFNSPTQNQGKNKSEIFPILHSAELLQETSINALLSDIENSLMVPKEVFSDIYLNVINRYAEFVQSLPNPKHPNFNFPKGQLLLGLIRASITLDTSGKYLCPEKQLPNTLSNLSKLSTNKLISSVEQEKRMAIWQFAIFSSSLLLDLGQSISKFQVDTCHENYENLAPWLLLNGSMLNNPNSTHYIYELTDGVNNSSAHKLNVFFAKLIIPNFIFNWLYTEKDIFFEWLNILLDESGGTGTLAKLTVESLRKLLNEYMGVNLPKDLLQFIPKHIDKSPEYHKDSFWKGVEHSLRGKHKDHASEHSTEGYAGEEFLEWLKEGIANESIKVNSKDANVHMSKEGVFLFSPEVFIEFSGQSTKHPNWLTVFKQFNQLGITKIMNDSHVFQAGFPHLNNPGDRRGVVVADASNIFGASAIPSISPAISTDPARVVPVSKIFPTSAEESVSAYKHVFNPNPNNT